MLDSFYFDEVEETRGKIASSDGHSKESREIMRWCNESEDEEISAVQITTTPEENSASFIAVQSDGAHTITCPACGYTIQYQDQVFNYIFNFFFVNQNN